MDLLWIILLVANLVYATLRSIFPAMRMDSLTAGDAAICQTILLVGCALYFKLNRLEQKR